ncbi:Fis family PAS modulated sigma54 specific transcriptional regulator, partial [Candidatus Magnetobacterium bavaricum]
IRELRNLIRRVVLFCKCEVISLEDIMSFLDVDDNSAENIQRLSLKEIMERKEIETILAAIEESNGNKTKAASMLGITYRWLAKRLHDYGIVYDKT